jgi:preprotein translocase subunit SecD
MKQSRRLFLLILFIVFISIIIAIPKSLPISLNFSGREIKLNLARPPIDLKIGDTQFVRDFDIKKGLDLQGGMQVTLSADMSNIEEVDRLTALDSVQTVISRRVDLYGVSESSIKTSVVGSDYRLIIELPGINNPGEALDLIGQTAKLEFATPIYQSDPASPSAEEKLVDFSATDLTGADLKTAKVTYETDDRSPAVAIEFKDSGKEKFANLTKEYLNEPLAIILDNQVISAPVVQTIITNGQAIISGKFSSKEAKFLATQLNAGALPVSVKVISQKNIPATLGEDSVRRSLIAGAVGLSMVVLFMSLYYGRLGIIASVGLFIYGLITIAIYKLIPVTLTLPGIAGFILSVGMAVDSNILIFERFKEEIRANRDWRLALELSFGRAWDSIRDANISTIMTGLILFNPLNWNFLNTSGMVRGFALTLILGILISLFTGIVVTRTLLRLFYRGPRPTSTLKVKDERSTNDYSSLARNLPSSQAGEVS